MACIYQGYMLIITRRKGQRICLGHDIEIVITEISRSGVKIGVAAPSSLTILRGEVRDAVEQANRDAVSGEFAEPVGLTVEAIPALQPPAADGLAAATTLVVAEREARSEG